MESLPTTAPAVLPPDLLARPAAETARRLAWHHLANAIEARHRLASPEDAEALHDLRVALRRLRSVLQDWRGELADTVPGRYVRQLRRLSRATGEGRDLEVRLALCDQASSVLRAEGEAGVRWLRTRLASRQPGVRSAAVAAVARAMPELEGDLAARLERYRVELDLRGGRAQPGTPAALARLVEQGVRRVRERLAAVHGPADQPAAHRARIGAKRLRYLLEPFRHELPGARDVVAGLVVFQDRLGDYRDASGLAAEIDALLEGPEAGVPLARPEDDERQGLGLLATHLRERAAAEFAAVRAEWLGSGVPAVLVEAQALAGRLERIADPREIERKFLLRECPARAREGECLMVEQGYLPGGLVRERLRRTARGRTVEYWRSIKAGRGVTRVEVEEPLDESLFARLWPLTEGSRVAKRRYLVSDGGVTWEVDEFLDRDLVVAEVELADPGQQVPLPSWLAEVLVREVTGEPEYLNSSLAR